MDSHFSQNVLLVKPQIVSEIFVFIEHMIYVCSVTFQLILTPTDEKINPGNKFQTDGRLNKKERTYSESNLLAGDMVTGVIRWFFLPFFGELIGCLVL